MTTKKILPPKHLQNYIRFFWVLDFNDISKSNSLFKVFARKYPRLVIQHNDGNSGIYHDNAALPLGYFCGLNTNPYDCTITPSISILGVSFHPHGLKAIFGVDTSEIVNELPDITNFISRDYIEKLVESKSVQEKINILCELFTKELLLNEAKQPVIEKKAWDLILRGTDEMAVVKLSKYFNLSTRQIQRIFKANFGLTPKQFLQINRFEKAIDLLKTVPDKKLLDIAYELEYSDSSHFIREFKQFSGQAPSGYLKLNKLYDESSAFILSNYNFQEE
jgi:AraC-like DNA-binding protein